VDEAASDLGLVQRLLERDEAAFASLVDRYHARLVRLALAFVANREAAEEVVQDTWLAVIRGLETFRGESALKTWIFQILTNRARTRGARDARTVPFSSVEGPEGHAGFEVDAERFTREGSWADPPRRWDETSPEAHLLRRETLRLLETAIAELPERQRAVVLLRDVEGLGSEDVCNVLQVSETNQRVLLHRARARLRRVLEEHLGGA
jgi:RNA polymerase sigma-70 factor (ECF subfamily)